MGLSGLEISLFKHGVVALVGMPYSTSEGMAFMLGRLVSACLSLYVRCLYGIACYNIPQNGVAWQIVAFLFYYIRTLEA
jgi:hypothetical protein